MSRNHARTELDALNRDGFVILTEEPGALLVRIVADAMFWRCSQIQDRPTWLKGLNTMRQVNGLEQLAFPPEQFAPNEPTLAEAIAIGQTFSREPAGALPVYSEARCRRSEPSYSPISHNGNYSHNGNRKPLNSNDGTPSANSNSNSINRDSLIRTSNSKGSIPITGNTWRSDGYIIEKLACVPAIARELYAGRTKSSTDFEQLYHLDSDRARQLIGSAASLPPVQANGRPSNPCRWFNKTVSDQLWKATIA